MAQSPMDFSLTTKLSVLILSLITLCFASDYNSSKQRDSKLFPSCNGGQTGMWTYMTCVPGAPGAPGRDGAKGDLGSPGKNGAKGEPGIQGSTGQKGQRGYKGDNGTTQLSSHINWKECTWPWSNYDNKDSGVIYYCDFMKNYTNTALHVYFAGNIRIRGCDSCCSRWYFTFQGTECSSPGPVEGTLMMWTGKKQDLVRHRHIEGHCNNIHRGKVRVGFWVGKCKYNYKLADGLTGWGEISRIFIEEVPKAQQ